MDNKNIKLLNEFANDHVLATHIKVVVSDYHKSFTPRTPESYAKYEDANLLASMIMGAESLVYYLERNGYIIKKKR